MLKKTAVVILFMASLLMTVAGIEEYSSVLAAEHVSDQGCTIKTSCDGDALCTDEYGRCHIVLGPNCTISHCDCTTGLPNTWDGSCHERN